MATNLLDLISRGLGGDFANTAGSLLGESSAGTRSALDAALPALLGGLVRKGSTAQGAAGVLDLLKASGVDASALGNIAGTLGGGGLARYAETGSGVLSALFGDKVGALSSAIAGPAGVKSSSVTSLVAAAAPFVLGLLKRQVSDSNLGASGLQSLLLAQKDTLASRLPEYVTRSLGWGTPANFASGLAQPVAPAEPERRSGNRWLPWVLAAIAAAILLSMLSRCQRKDVVPAASTPAVSAPVAAAAPDAVKIYFDAGSAALPADASAAIGPIVAFAAANPGTRVAISGFHSADGDPAANDEIAKNRAIAVRDALVGAGVSEAIVVLDEPVISTGGGADDPEGRRVEVSIRR